MAARGVERRIESVVDIESLIVELLHEIAGVDPSLISRESTIDGDLEINSVTFVELQVALEDELDIVIDPVDIVELGTIGRISEYLLARC